MRSSAQPKTAQAAQDKLVETCNRVKFRDLDGSEYSDLENSEWQAKCASYCENPKRQTREEIPYHIFEQLFSPVRILSILEFRNPLETCRTY